MIIGNLTRNPELRYTSTGTSVVSFGVATNREYVPSNSNETVEATEFHNVVAWSKLAELCDKLLGKGDKVYIEGRLQTRDWQDEQSGKRLYRTEIVASEMILLTGKRSSGNDGLSDSPTEEKSSTNEPEVEAEDAAGEEIPF